jgi:hypothetical protein
LSLWPAVGNTHSVFRSEEGRGSAPPCLLFLTPAATAPRGSAGADFS